MTHSECAAPSPQPSVSMHDHPAAQTPQTSPIVRAVIVCFKTLVQPQLQCHSAQTRLGGTACTSRHKGHHVWYVAIAALLSLSCHRAPTIMPGRTALSWSDFDDLPMMLAQLIDASMYCRAAAKVISMSNISSSCSCFAKSSCLRRL